MGSYYLSIHLLFTAGACSFIQFLIETAILLSIAACVVFKHPVDCSNEEIELLKTTRAGHATIFYRCDKQQRDNATP